MSEMMTINEGTADVVVFGGNGYIGTAFVNSLESRGVKFFAPESAFINALHTEPVKAVLEATQPSFVINCAGHTGKPNVDACEDEKEQTHEGNVTIPFNLAQICDELSIPWGHVSSGCIYNGYEKEYTEEDEPNFSFDSPPCSYYSGTKAEAEKSLEGLNCYVWRLRIPFDEKDSPKNYLTKMIDYDIILNTENSVSHRKDFVEACLELWTNTAEYGTYNVTNTGSITANKVLDLFEKHQDIKSSAKLMNDIEAFYEEVKVKAPRSNCVLNNDKLVKAGVKMRSAEEAIEDAVMNWEPFGPREKLREHKRLR